MGYTIYRILAILTVEWIGGDEDDYDAKHRHRWEWSLADASGTDYEIALPSPTLSTLPGPDLG